MKNKLTTRDRRTSIFCVTLLITALPITAEQMTATQPARPDILKPHLAATPPMGWNSWSAFHKNIDEKMVRAQADAMVDLGLRDAGYRYVVIDGGWKTSSRDAQSNLVVDAAKFPSGMKALADYVHSRGLKFGLHQPAGIHDCGKDEPGSQGNEERDAALFASWGVDFIKYDQCDYVHDPQRVPGAPDLDKITVRQGSQTVFSAEAEAVGNRITGMARVEDRPLCSGGKCVAGIGYDGGSVEVPHVNVSQAGRYTLNVGYAYPYYGQNRDRFREMTFFVSVNGGERHRVDVPYDMAKRYTTASVSIDIDLHSGDNTILLDNPLSQEEDVRQSYIKMATALNHTGREIMFSTSGAARPWLWARPIAHLWRTSGDLVDRWSGGNTSILSTVDRQSQTLRWSEPGFWADPDCLQVGLRDMPPADGKVIQAPTDEEYQAHFSLWAIMNAPLFISADLQHLSDAAKRILLNRDVIAINQDPLATTGQIIRDEGAIQIFTKHLAGGDVAVAILNRGPQSTDVRITAAELGLAKSPLLAKNLWTGQLVPFATEMTVAVQSHNVMLLRIAGDEPAHAATPTSAPVEVLANIPHTVQSDGCLRLNFGPEQIILSRGLQPSMLATASGALIVQGQVPEKPFPSTRMTYPSAMETVISRDGGLTWTRFPLKAGMNGVNLEGGAIQLHDGTILALDTYVTPTEAAGRGVGQLYISNDDWRSLDGPRDVPFDLPHADFYASTDDGGHPYTAERVHRRLIEMPDGSLLATLYGCLQGDHTPCPYQPKMMKTRIMLVRSTDRGLHWQLVSTVSVDPSVGTEGLGEPTLCRVGSGSHVGRLICLMRTGRNLFQAISDDEGKSWIPAKELIFADRDVNRSELWADHFRHFKDFKGRLLDENNLLELRGAVVDPDIIELRSGILVACFGVRVPQKLCWAHPEHPWNGNYLAFSLDHGDTWTNVVQITSGVLTTHYMAIAETPMDNQLYITYDLGGWSKEMYRDIIGRSLKVTKVSEKGAR